MECIARPRVVIGFCWALALLLLGQNPASAQFRTFGGAVGTSHYIGDVGGSQSLWPWGASDLQKSRFAVTAFTEKSLQGRWQLRSGISVVQLAGDDRFADASSRIARNLHFRTMLVEGSVRGQYKFYDRPRHWNRSAGSRGYVFLGIGGFAYTPKAQIRNEVNDIINPTWYNLRELTTEGQDEPYGLFAFSSPMGVGFDWNLIGGWQLGVELSWRYTSTDYLDDVSRTYGNPLEIGDLAYQLSSQANAYSIALAGEDGGSLIDHQYSSTNEVKRGNPDSRDGFATLQMTISRPDGTMRTRPGSWVGSFRKQGKTR